MSSPIFPPPSPLQRQRVKGSASGAPVGRPGSSNGQRGGSLHDWTSVHVSELIKDQKVIEIDANAEIQKACESLLENKISSAPVYSTKDGYLGMFDYSDLTAFFLLLLRHYVPPEAEKDLNLTKIITLSQEGGPLPVHLASDISHKNPFVAVKPEATLGNMVEIFGEGQHRVAVLGENERIIGILSQSTVVNYLYDNAWCFPGIEPLYQKTISELNVGSQVPLTIQGDCTVLEAMEKMNMEGISSLAITDKQNTLIGSISVEDLEYVVKRRMLVMLHKTCAQFAAEKLAEEGVLNGQDEYPFLAVTPTSTLGYAVAKLNATRAHRLWVSDATFGGKLTGVVSLTDILSIFAKAAGKDVDPNSARKRRNSSFSSSSSGSLKPSSISM